MDSFPRSIKNNWWTKNYIVYM